MSNQEIINKFLELEAKKEAVKQYFKDLDEATKAVAEIVGINGYFQAPDGTVFKIVNPAGTFVEYKTVGYERTRREGEKRGSLSMKEAKEAGFDIG